MSTVHRNLTGADLHEPKGADTALSGSVYVANGSGSGVWTDASTIITNTAFTTGDLKPTHKVTADTGWILWSNGSIGDGSSSATIRANVDTSDLFALYWNNYNNTICPVSGGRGASAAADFAAHKRLSIPLGAARALGLAGVASDLSSTRSLGETVGVETVTLTASQLPAAIPYTLTWAFTPTTSGTKYVGDSAPVLTNVAGGTSAPVPVTYVGATFGGSVAVSGGSINPGGGSSHTNMQPTTFVNVMIKL